MVHIVILGGGFGAVYTAKKLQSYVKKHPEHRLTLIAEQPTFVFAPLLHELAAGIIDPATIQVELQTLLSIPTYSFIRGKIDYISLKNKTIFLSQRTIHYDILVIALGAKTREKGKRTLKTLADALQIRKELALLSPHVPIGIVGGGPTGIELAGELVQNFPNITLYQRAPVILPHVSSRFREAVGKCLMKKKINIVCNMHVEKYLKGGKYLIWCTGVKPELPPIDVAVINDTGEILVGKTLQVNNTKDVFSLGDGAATGAPKLAQAAEQQAQVVVVNVTALLEQKELVPFSFKYNGFLLSVGQFCGVGEIAGFVFSGFFAWWLKRTIYLFKIVGLLPKWKLALEYTRKMFNSKYPTESQGILQQHRGKRDTQERQ